MNFIHRIYERLRARHERRLPAGSTRAQRGKFGEDLAAEHCRSVLGYRELVRNWRYKRDELDLICQDGEVLVFVEVRARAEDALVPGYYTVDRHKKAVLRRGCANYLKQLRDPPKHFRFDIVDVSISKGGRGEVHHYANVPLFNKHFQSHSRKS